MAKIPDSHSSILTFYGVGGQGKTLLCEKFQRILKDDPSFRSIKWGAVDLNGKIEREPIYLLLWIRGALARNGLRTTTFDFAYELYRKSAERSHVLPQIPTGWLETISDGAGETSGELAKAHLEADPGLLEEAAAGIPFIGGAVKYLGKKIARWSYEAWLRRTNDALSDLYRDGALLPPIELAQALPRMLAKDLDSWRIDHPGAKFVLLIDEYESLLESGGASDLLRGASIDATMREIVSTCTATLFVFFSRERLRWDEADPRWSGVLSGRQHFLDGLSPSDADRLLVKAGIGDHRLRRAMIDGASAVEMGGTEQRVYPIVLDLQVQLFHDLNRHLKPVTEDSFQLGHGDFEAKRREIFVRILRNYRPDVDATLQYLAVARRFDEALFKFVVQEFGTSLPLDQWSVLIELSFVQPARNSENMFAFHGVIRATLESFLGAAEKKRAHAGLFKYFDGLLPAGSIRSLTKDHAAIAIEAFYHAKNGNPRSTLEWWDVQSQRFQDSALAASIELLDREAVDVARDTFREDSHEYGRRLSRLGMNLHAQGKYAEAAALHESTLRICEVVLGQQDIRIAVYVDNLADTFYAQGQYEKAAALYRRALAIRRIAREPEPADIARSLRHLGNTSYAQDKYAEAELLHREALEIWETTPDSQYPEVPACLSNLAAALDAQGKHGPAEEMHRRAVTGYYAKLGRWHPDTATILNNLANNLDAQSKYAEAGKLHRRALAIRRAVLGKEHPDTAVSLSNLATSLDSRGQYAKAEELHRCALAIYDAALGAQHPHSVVAFNNLANNLAAQDRNAEAEGLHRRALAVCEAVLAAHTPISLSNLAVTLDAQGKHGEGEGLHRRALALCEDRFGKLHPRTAIVLSRLAASLDRAGKSIDANPMHSGAIDILLDRYGDGHPHVAQARALRVRCLHSLGYEDEARAMAHAAHAVLLKVNGPSHRRTLDIAAYLGETCGRSSDKPPSETK